MKNFKNLRLGTGSIRNKALEKKVEVKDYLPYSGHWLAERLELSDKSFSGLLWRKRPRSDFKNERAYKIWNSKFPGTEAGTRKSKRILINNVSYKLEAVYERVRRHMRPEERQGKVVTRPRRVLRVGLAEELEIS